MKQSEINNLSLADLQDKLAEFQKQLSELNMAHTITPLENNHCLSHKCDE